MWRWYLDLLNKQDEASYGEYLNNQFAGGPLGKAPPTFAATGPGSHPYVEGRMENVFFSARTDMKSKAHLHHVPEFCKSFQRTITNLITSRNWYDGVNWNVYESPPEPSPALVSYRKLAQPRVGLSVKSEGDVARYNVVALAALPEKFKVKLEPHLPLDSVAYALPRLPFWEHRFLEFAPLQTQMHVFQPSVVLQRLYDLRDEVPEKAEAAAKHLFVDGEDLRYPLLLLACSLVFSTPWQRPHVSAYQVARVRTAENDRKVCLSCLSLKTGRFWPENVPMRYPAMLSD